MAVVSVSLNEKMLCDLDELQEEKGYTGRSEIVRDALRLLLAEQKEQSKLKGYIDAVLFTIHDEKDTEEISALRHKHQPLIRTQIHNHLESGNCLELFVLRGDAKKITKLADEFQANRKIEFVKLVVA